MLDQAREAGAKLPQLLEEVALVDAKVAAATGGMSISWWQAEVAAGRAPQPVIREVRCVRYRLVDVRNFWIERAARGSDPAVAKRIQARAERASAAASSKRLGGEFSA